MSEEVIVHNPENTLRQIDELYVFVSIDKGGREGLCGAPIPGHPGTMPLVTTDKGLVDRVMMPIAREMGKITDKKVRLIKLTNREVVEDL